MNSHLTPTPHDRARAALAIGPVTWSSGEGNGHFHMSVDSLPSELIDAQLAALEAAGLAVVEAERDALLAQPDVDREELAIELCREIGAEVYQLVNGDIDQMCGIVGIHEPEGWLSVADALLATWRVVRR